MEGTNRRRRTSCRSGSDDWSACQRSRYESLHPVPSAQEKDGADPLAIHQSGAGRIWGTTSPRGNGDDQRNCLRSGLQQSIVLRGKLSGARRHVPLRVRRTGRMTLVVFCRRGGQLRRSQAGQPPSSSGASPPIRPGTYRGESDDFRVIPAAYLFSGFV